MARKTKGRYKSPNDEIRCAGTMDFKGYLRKLGDEIWILDWKSAKDDYPEYRMQTAKYREMDGEATRNGIVLLDKETGFPRFVDHSDTYERDIERFNLTDLLCPEGALVQQNQGDGNRGRYGAGIPDMEKKRRLGW